MQPREPFPHLIAHKVASTTADADKKQKKVDIDMKHSQEAFVDAGVLI